MKVAPECYECLRRLIHQATELATNDASLRRKAIAKAMNILDTEFSSSQLSIVIATMIHQAIRDITRNPDPYKAMKEREMALARKLYDKLSLSAKPGTINKDELADYLKLAALANAIDFFREPELIRADLSKSVRFTIDDSEQFAAKLRHASKILYLADNAGEVYFDLPLVNYLKQLTQVIYVVKPSPVQDDLTLADVREAGLQSEVERIITTGVASPGIIFSLASAEFKQEFEAADLVLAKGMGHYEALSELPAKGRFFYCLKAKCQPVADSLGVPINSYVAMLR